MYVRDINLTKNDVQIIGRNSDTVKFEKFGITYIKFRAKELIEELEKYNETKNTSYWKARSQRMERK